MKTEQEHAQPEAEVNEALAFFGLVAEGPVLPRLEPFYLWPENLEAWDLFMAVQTQWRGSGMAREGLDYAGVDIVMGQRRKWRLHRRRRLAEVQVMERACLTVWAEQAKAAERQP